MSEVELKGLMRRVSDLPTSFRNGIDNDITKLLNNEVIELDDVNKIKYNITEQERQYNGYMVMMERRLYDLRYRR